MPRSMAKVVVLDDDRVMVELLRTVIEDEGHQAVSAVQMDDVPASVRADLVVSDLMPLTSYRADVARQWVRDLHDRSEEHTSELQSRGHLVCRLLLEKKK